MLDISKQTSCGRFIVTIETRQVGGDLLLTTDVARSLTELSDILANASSLARELAVRIVHPATESVS
jgi:hypothetical protein